MQYARWATKEEMKERLCPVILKETIETSGVPLLYEEDTMYIDKFRSHTLLIGSTGSGKSQTTILPIMNLSMKAQESFFVIDPKGEFYQRLGTELEQEGYQTTILDLDNTSLGNNWNPLALPYEIYQEGNKDKAQDMIEEIGYYLFADGNDKTSDPFWINTTTDYFTGLTLYLFETAKKEEINLNNVAILSNSLTKEQEGISFMEKLNPHSTIYANLAATLKAPKDTKGSILSVFQQKIKPFISRENLSNLLSTTDTSFEDILNNKSAIFIIASDITEVTKRLIPLYISQLIESKNIYKNDKPFNMLLDEFGIMLKMKNIANLLIQARSSRIQITAVIQNYMQLVNVYGKEEAELLKLGFTNIIYLLSNDIYSLEEISKTCGEVSKDVPLITVEELKTMKQFEAIVVVPRMYPFKTKLKPNYKIDWGYQETKSEIPTRKVQQVSYID